MTEKAYQICINPDCRRTYSLDQIIFSCEKCKSLLDVAYDWDRLAVPTSLEYFEHRWATKGLRADGRLDFSGVWRFRELLPFVSHDSIVTIGEGRTLLEQNDHLGRQLGMKPGRLFLQYEGLNPSGSFKDNGMTAAFSLARRLGRHRVACASTGNTSASLAMFANKSDPPMVGIVFIGSGKIAYGKLSQALDYGALTLQIQGDFDACLRRVLQVADKLGLYIMNSVNPFRLEGQKAIMYRILEARNWEVPDWIIVPGGNLGNSSAFGKAFFELKELGLIDRVPRLAIINATGANTLRLLVEEHKLCWRNGEPDTACIRRFYETMDAEHRRASTIASAIEINRPVNLHKCIRAIEVCNGVVREVSDQLILDAKAQVGAGGLGCEPASAASVAGAKLLVSEGIIGSDERVVCVLTGHQLKDPDATVAYHTTDQEMFNRVLGKRGVRRASFANRAVAVPNDINEIIKAIQLYS